jgi:hypothetical protein
LSIAFVVKRATITKFRESGTGSLRSELTTITREQRMRNNDLSAMLIVAVLAAFTGTATYAQQTAPQSTPQVQEVPVTPEGKPPPAEITPSHPLPTTNQNFLFSKSIRA